MPLMAFSISLSSCGGVTYCARTRSNTSPKIDSSL